MKTIRNTKKYMRDGQAKRQREDAIADNEDRQGRRQWKRDPWDAHHHSEDDRQSNQKRQKNHTTLDNVQVQQDGDQESLPRWITNGEKLQAGRGHSMKRYEVVILEVDEIWTEYV